MIAQALREITPAPARAGHPEKRIEEQAVVRARTALALGPPRDELLDPLPLVVSKRVAIHRRSPKSALNPITLPLRTPNP